jgi:hypothetical protein
MDKVSEYKIKWFQRFDRTQRHKPPTPLENYNSHESINRRRPLKIQLDGWGRNEPTSYPTV